MYVFMFWENEHQWKLIQNINPQKNNQNHVDRIIWSLFNMNSNISSNYSHE